MWPQCTLICVSASAPKALRAWTPPDVALVLPPQLSFAAMHISSHRALEYIPPVVYGAIRIGSALPLLVLSARLQVPVLSSPPTFPCRLSQRAGFSFFVIVGLAS